jgi:hypothetical protein
MKEMQHSAIFLHENAIFYGATCWSKTRKVLFEKQARGSMMEGYTDNYIRVTASFRKELVNNIV